MHSKLLIVSAGTFGFGALLGWAVTADHFERKMKSNQLLLGDMLRRQGAELAELRNERVDRILAEADVPWTSPTDEAVAEQVDKLQNGSETATPMDDGVAILAEINSETGVETDSENSPGGNSDENEAPAFPAGETREQTRSRLQELIDRYAADPEAAEAFVNTADKMLEYASETPPFVISQGLYANDADEGDDYSKITISYYPRNRILLDDDDELIDDIENTVGWKNLRQFGGESGDPSVVFIRNRRLETDFEVVQYEDEDPPLHIQYAMGREEFKTQVAAGIIKLRDEDRD